MEVRPRDAGKPTLVLDLNGTLVSSCEVRRSVLDRLTGGSSSSGLYDATLTVHGSAQRLSVRKRPGLDRFLHEMAEVYEIVIFSHSEEPQVTTLVQFLDPRQEVVSHVLARPACTGDLKDLRSPKFRRELSRVVWLDDSVESFINCPDNGIVVPSFDVEVCHHRGVDPGKDTLLLTLAPFLKAISQLEDVRHAIELYKSKQCKVVDGMLMVKNAAGWGWHPFGEQDTSGCSIM